MEIKKSYLKDKNFLEDFFKSIKSIYKVEEENELLKKIKKEVFETEKKIFLEDFYFLIKSLESNILSITEKKFSLKDIKEFFVFIIKEFKNMIFFENMNEKQKFLFLKELELFFLLVKDYDFDFKTFFENISVLKKDHIILLLFNYNEFENVNVYELKELFLSFKKEFFIIIEEKNSFENFLEYLNIIKDSLEVFLEYFEENISILNSLFLKYEFDTFKITALIRELLNLDGKKVYEYLQLKET